MIDDDLSDLFQDEDDELVNISFDTEDIDLSFKDRSISYNTSNLSEFMDILDGFTNNEDVIFILNTNVTKNV